MIWSLRTCGGNAIVGADRERGDVLDTRRDAGRFTGGPCRDPHSRLVWRDRIASVDSPRRPRTRLVTRSTRTKSAISYALPMGSTGVARPADSPVGRSSAMVRALIWTT